MPDLVGSAEKNCGMFTIEPAVACAVASDAYVQSVPIAGPLFGHAFGASASSGMPAFLVGPSIGGNSLRALETPSGVLDAGSSTPIARCQLPVVPFARTEPQLLDIVDINDSCPRFVFEGKVLNRYGTYRLVTDSKQNISRYLKCDLTDCHGFDTITLSVTLIRTYAWWMRKLQLVHSFALRGPL